MTEENTYEGLYREVIPSVVSVYVIPREGGRGGPAGAGSGFVYERADDVSNRVESGYVLTNQHVVGALETVELRFSEGDWRTGEVVGTDAYADLAVVGVEDLPEYAAALPVAEANPPPGRRVAALGNPMGLDGTITSGIVSGTNRSTPTGGNFAIPDIIQTDAPINPGNSGGPLVTLDGEVVGVNRARQGDNIGFAISPVLIARVVPELIAQGIYRHSYLNVRTIDVSPTVASANGLDEPRGVLVVDVSLGPASGALKGATRTHLVRGREVPVGGDVIVGLDGRRIDSHEELMSYLITETRPGDVVELELVRDGRHVHEHVTLGERRRPYPGGRITVR